MMTGEEIKKRSTTSNPGTDLKVLLEKARSGDEKAFRQLYDLYSGKMYSLCKRYVGNSTEADDVFQDAFVKIYRWLADYSGEGSFEGWMRKIFVNTCIDHLKHRNEGILVATDLENNLPLHPMAEGHADVKLSNEDLLKAMQKMPLGYKMIVNLYLVEGYSHKEISELLNISEGTSKSQLSRGKLKLKEIMESYHG